MFLNNGSKRFGWLAMLALAPVVGWGQIFIEHPQNQTVCVGKKAIFTSRTNRITSGWVINNVNADGLSPEEQDFIRINKNVLQGEGTTLTLEFLPSTPIHFSGTNISVLAFDIQEGSIESEYAYLFYEANQQHPVTDLIATANDTAIQLGWKANAVRTQYLVSVSNVTETPVVTNSTDFVYFPESQDCKWYEFMVTAHECFNATDSDISQTTGATVRVAYPNISPVILEHSGQEVLVNWASNGNSVSQINITDLESGNQTLITHTGNSSFSYDIPPICGEFNLNVAVSPAECVEPAFTDSASIRFSIACPTTATEAETSGEHSGTLANYPSLLLAVAAIVPLLRYYD